MDAVEDLLCQEALRHAASPVFRWSQPNRFLGPQSLWLRENQLLLQKWERSPVPCPALSPPTGHFCLLDHPGPQETTADTCPQPPVSLWVGRMAMCNHQETTLWVTASLRSCLGWLGAAARHSELGPSIPEGALAFGGAARLIGACMEARGHTGVPVSCTINAGGCSLDLT